MGSIECKTFCTEKETIIKMKRQPIEWQKIFANIFAKIFANHTSNKRSIFKIYDEHIQLSKKTNNPI